MTNPQNCDRNSTRMDAHSEVVKLLDQLRDRAKVFSPKVQEEFNSVTDSIETLTKAYMVPKLAVDWTEYGLTPTERRLMMVLHHNFGRTVTYASLENAAYYDREMGHKLLNVYASKIRAKFFRDQSCPFMIETDWGTGYKLVRKEDWQPARDKSIKRTNGAYLAALEALKAA